MAQPPSRDVVVRTAGFTIGRAGAQVKAPFDVAVVITTIVRPTLTRALRSIFAQQFDGRIHIVLGVDVTDQDQRTLVQCCDGIPENCVVSILDPGYSTSTRHGGFHRSWDGGAMRTVLSYLAHARHVAYLDDDNWWAPDHLASLKATIDGRAWAYSLRWFADSENGRPLCVDRWESVGPDAGIFKDRFGGFVDPNCLMIDKVACETVLEQWSRPLDRDKRKLSADRRVFDSLRKQPGACTGKPTSFYVLNVDDPNHGVRQQWISQTLEQQANRTVH